MQINDFHIGNNWESYERNRQQKRRGLLTGFREVDKAIIQLPGLVNIMGDTGCGKSTFVLNILLYNAMQGVPVILVDNENGCQRTRTRMLCYLGNITQEAVESNTFYDDEEERYLEAVEQLQKLPIFYFSEMDKYKVEDFIEAVGAEYKKHVLVVLDSLHTLLDGSQEEIEELKAWVNQINTLKNKYDGYLTFIMISEKSKDQYGRGTNKGAKGSSSIDYRSELTLNLYPTSNGQGAVLECKKNRDGKKGVITVLYPDDPFTYHVTTGDDSYEQFT